jgi:hypothetical protein
MTNSIQPRSLVLPPRVTWTPAPEGIQPEPSSEGWRRRVWEHEGKRGLTFCLLGSAVPAEGAA